MSDPTEPTERWLPVPGLEEYEVSDRGNIRRNIPQYETVGGYMAVAWPHSRYKMVHHLVTLAFLGPRPDGLVTRHLDGNPKNNALENLAYGTTAENNRDTVRHGTHAKAKLTHCPNGHAYTEDNIYRMPSHPQRRFCRECRRINSERRYGRKRQEEGAA